MPRQDIDLYQIGQTPEELQSALIQLRQEFDAHNHDGSSSRAFQTVTAEAVTSRVYSIRKLNYSDDAAGMWMGLVGDDPRLYFGTASQYLKFEEGVLSLTGATVSGYIAVGGAATDVNDNVTLIQPGKISANQLSAISADLGTITAGTITGVLFRTAASGTRIEMDTTNTNQIRFYDSSTVYGWIEVTKSGSDGHIVFGAQDDGAQVDIYTGVGASAFSSISITSVGGQFTSSGNASSGFNDIKGQNGGFFGVRSDGSGNDFMETDIKFKDHWIPYSNNTYDLGSSSLKWRNLYLQGDINGADDINCNTIFTDNIYDAGGTWILDVDPSAGPQFRKPLGLDKLSSTPGAASSYEGYIYYDTTKTNLVFSDGTGWFETQASSY